jgi:hypothetical protein
MSTRKLVNGQKPRGALGEKLLASVRQMKARNFARATEVLVNESGLGPHSGNTPNRFTNASKNA